MMKNKLPSWLLVLLVSLLSWGASAQVMIGTGSTINQGLPLEPNYGFNYSQSIYLASEINASGNITSLKYFTNAGTGIADSDEWTVYMGHTTKSSFTGSTDWVDLADLTQVFTGTVTLSGNEVTVTLSAPFAYNGTDNLVVAVDENAASWDSSSDDFLSSGVSSDRSLLYRNDNTNPDPASPPAATYVREYVANIEFGGITEACPLPTALTATNILPTALDFGWTENGSATSWGVEYGTAGFTPTGTATTTVTSNPANITGLTANTAYEFYVQADCGGSGTSAWVGPFAVTTPCASLTAPWSEPFATAVLPTCWSESGDNAWEYGSDVTTPTGFADYGAENAPDHTFGGGGTFIGMDGSDNGNGDVSVLTSPLIDVSGLTNGQLSYWVFYNNTNDAALNKLIVDVYDGANWVQVDSIQQNLGASWVEFTTALSTLTITGDVQVRFTITGDNSMGGNTYYNDILIDDVSFDEIPSCLSVTALNSANVTATSLDLSWTENGSATSWNIEYGTTGFTPTGTATISGSTTNPHNVTGLTGNTTYDFYVQADCGGSGTSAWAGPYTVSTPCGIYIPTYSQDFSSYIPGCWEEGNGSLGTSSTVTAGSSSWTSDGFANSGSTGAARMEIYTGAHDEWLISPSIDLTGGPFQLKYDVAMTVWNSTSADLFESDDTLAIVISTDNGATWSTSNLLKVYASGSEPSHTGQSEIIDLSAYSGIVKIGFYAASTVNGSEDLNVYIDNFVVEPIPACQGVSTLTASNIAVTTLDLGWTQIGTETAWNIEYGTAGFTPTGTPTIAGTSTNPTNITGLMSNTEYEFYVQADCAGSGTSTWAGPFTATTLCDALPVPFAENFGSTSTTEVCWTVLNNNGDNDAWNTNYTSNELTADQVAVLYTDGNNGSNDDYLISPKLTLTGNERLRYSYRAQSSGEPNDFEVLLSTTGLNTADFTTTLVPLKSVSNTTYEEDLVGLTAYSGDVYIAFHVPSGGLDGWRLYIDSFVVETMPACSEVTTIVANNITDNSLELGWTQLGTETTWNIEYDVTGFTQTGTPTTSVTTNPANITGLTPNTTYDFYVQADCAGSGTSPWVGPVSFTTPCAPFDGDDAATPITLTGTTVSYTGNTSDCFTNTSDAGGSNTAPDAWHAYTLETCTDSLIVSLCGSSFDTYLRVYAADGTTVIDFNDDNSECSTGNNSHIELDLNATAGIAGGDLIYIVVDGYGANSGAYSLNVTQIESPVAVVDVQTSCDSIVWNGTTYTTSGTYSWTGVDALGCDSLVTLDLTINTSSTFTDVQTSCDSIVWNGTTYTTSGMYTWNGTTAAGCDSTVMLDLTITNSTTGTDVQTACDSLVWNGTTYNTSGTYTWTGTNAAGCDSTVTLDLTILNSTTGTDVQTACISYTWIDGNTYTASNNTATWTLTNAAGCDSIVTLDLTINTVDIAVTNNDPELVANASGATYQWLDCNNGNAAITGETGQTFTATANGDYAVEVTENGCTDTSACVTVATISVEHLSPLDLVSVYPNPTSSLVNVDLGDLEDATVTLLDLNGKVLMKKENTSEVFTFELNQLPGVYFIEVETADRLRRFKLIKE